VCSSRVFAALTADQLLLVVNQNEPEGVKLATYYAKARGVPPEQVIALDVSANESIDFLTYEKQIAAPVRTFLKDKNLSDKVKCLVTFYGVPLRITPRQLSDAEKIEVADLRLQREKLSRQLLAVTQQLETLAGKVAPGFQPKSAANDPANARQRLSAAAGAIHAALQNITDPAVKSEIEKQAALIEQAMLVPESISTQPSTLPADVNPATLAQDKPKLDRLQLAPFDPDNRKILRAATRLGGLLVYSETVENHLEYLATERVEACVDSELAMVQWVYYPRARWVPNPLCPVNRVTDAPTILLTARLDAPNPQLVTRMIDDSIAVEKEGLKGKVVIDSRGIPARKPDGTNDGYGQTDEQLRNLARNLQRHTQLTVVADDSPDVIIAKSVTDVAFYVGWYNPRMYIPSVSFVKGAVGYHIASYEMESLHDPNYRGWVPNLIKDGIDGTLGPTFEPYLAAFPRPDDFFNLVLTGKLTMAEVFWHTAPLMSWQVGYVGDPLYTPCKTNPVFQKQDIARWLQPIIE
jgi:uncharacterized protein (TIGR03790 family)